MDQLTEVMSELDQYPNRAADLYATIIRRGIIDGNDNTMPNSPDWGRRKRNNVYSTSPTPHGVWTGRFARSVFSDGNKFGVDKDYPELPTIQNPDGTDHTMPNDRLEEYAEIHENIHPRIDHMSTKNILNDSGTSVTIGATVSYFALTRADGVFRSLLPQTVKMFKK